MLKYLHFFKSPAVIIFLFFLLFYVSITSGNWWESDSMTAYQATKAMIDNHNFSIPCFWGSKALDGNCYSQYGLFMSIIIIPFYLIDKFFLEVIKSNYFFEGFFSSLTNCFITSLIVAIIYKYLRKFNFTPALSVFGALLFGLFSYAPAYSKTLFSEPITTLLILGIFYLLLFLKPAFKVIIIAGTLLGLAFLTKIASIIIAPCILLIFIYRKFPLKYYIYFSIPFLINLGIFFVYNYIRFGNVLDTGYRDIKLDTNIFYGLYLHFISPGKSFFFYQPFIIFSLFGFKSFFQKQQLAFLVFLQMTVINFLFYSIYMHPTGDLTWGSRYIYITLPFFIFSVIFFLKYYILKSKLTLQQKTLKYLFIFSLLVSFLITCSAIYLSYHRYYSFIRLKLGPDYTHIAYQDPNYSPLFGQFKIIFHLGANSQELPFWREAFQEYVTFDPNYKIAPPDLFFLRSKRELPIFILITIIEVLLIKRITSLLKRSSKKL